MNDYLLVNGGRPLKGELIVSGSKNGGLYAIAAALLTASPVTIHNIPEIADAAIVASGTATLQAAIMHTPAVVVYKMNALSWYLTQKMIKVNYASMANIIAEEEVFPEYLQSNANIQNLYKGIYKILNEKHYRQELNKKIKLINKKIGLIGASKRAAEHILNN